MALRTYLDFAENDYNYFRQSYEHGIVANAMAADAQEICEKYMKHVIDQYYMAASMEEQAEYETVMRPHNLLKLVKFIEGKMGISLSAEMKNDLRSINGYYFTARYPGDESIEVTRDDLELCMKAVGFELFGYGLTRQKFSGRHAIVWFCGSSASLLR